MSIPRKLCLSLLATAAATPAQASVHIEPHGLGRGALARAQAQDLLRGN